MSVFERFASSFEDLHEVVQSAEVICRGERYRLDVLRSYSPTDERPPFTVYAWVLEDVSLSAPTESTATEPTRTVHLWRTFPLPFINEAGPEAALERAFTLLQNQDWL